MSKSNFGLSNPYLKLGLALLLLGAGLVVGAITVLPDGRVELLVYVGGALFTSGVIVYVAGRIGKALQSTGK